MTKPAHYRIARYPDGTLRWAFSHTTGYEWVNTGVVIPSNVWSHVAVTYDNGLVESFLNGRLIHSQQLTGDLVAAGDPNASLTIGGRSDLTATLYGTLDDLQIYGAALDAADLDAIAQAGSGSLCIPYRSTMTLTAPSTIPYGPTFRATLLLRDEAGNPLAGKEVLLSSHVGGTGSYAASGRTDAAGLMSYDLRIDSNAALGEYPHAVSATFDGDNLYAGSSAEASATLVAGDPALTWPAPAPIVYGTALDAPMLNASANTSGTFSYSPAAGTILNAGTHTLTVTFTPDDPDRWTEAMKTTAIVVNKAAPSIAVTGGTFTYDKQAHPGSATATGVLGEALSPLELLYDETSATPPINAGAHTVRASFAGSENYTAGQSAAVPLTINKAVPVVEISGDALFYTGTPRHATVTVRGVGGDTLNPYTVLYNGDGVLPVQAGTYAVHVEFGGNLNYEAAIGDGTLVINKTTPIMSIGAENVTYDGQPHGASAGVVGADNEWLTPVTITYNGSTAEPIDAGVYAVEARYDGSANYEAISRTTSLTIFKAAPYLRWFPGPASIVYGTPLGAAQLSATADVPGTFDYSPAAGTIVNAGTETLTAVFTPADEVNYTTRSMTAALAVSKATPGVVWAHPADVVFGTALGATQLNAGATVPGTFTYTPAAGAVLNAGTHVLGVAFTPDDASNYNGLSTGAVLTVTKAPVTIGWPAPADIVYGTALGAAQLNASAGVPGTFTYSPAAGTVPSAGLTTLSVTFTPGDDNYAGATATVPLNVLKATPAVTWPAPADVVFGALLDASQLNATASEPGTFVYAPAAGTAPGAGTHTLTVTFTPYETANFGTATATVSLNVAKATAVLTWATPQSLVYGAALSSTELNAAANVPGTFTYTPPAGTVLEPGAAHVVGRVHARRRRQLRLVERDHDHRCRARHAVHHVDAARSDHVRDGDRRRAPQRRRQRARQLRVHAAGRHAPGRRFQDLVRDLHAGRCGSLHDRDAHGHADREQEGPGRDVDGPFGDLVRNEPGRPQLNAASDVTGTFTYSPASGTVLAAGSHSLSVMFVPDDAANHTAATADVTLTVDKAAAAVTWTAPDAIVYGTALGAAQLNAAANVPGTFAYSPSAGAVLAAGSHALSVSFTPDDAANYTGGTAGVTLSVAAGVHVDHVAGAWRNRLRHRARSRAAERGGRRARHLRVLAVGGHGARGRVAHAPGDVHAG